MSDEIGASVREWTDVVRRARLGRTVKGVALVLATYADGNGRRIFPGVARISVDAEVSYNVAKAALATLRDAGLIERVSYGVRRRGFADSYRLIMAADVLDRITILDPDQHKAEADKLTAKHGGRHRKPEPESDLQPTLWAAEDTLCSPAERLQEVALQPTGMAANTIPAEGFAAHGVTPKESFAAHGVSVLQPTPLATTNHGPRHITSTHHTDAGVDADVTVTRVAITEEPKIDPLPEKCSHNFRARRRADGSSSCALCRISARMAPAPRGATA